ncbi:AraC family transcriptional regulator [Streptomyces zagrosensis]|uniref:AraC-like DNA-binding protein n=1 Tax=Streptomyces zagrosensis TaxID=1042984 RepID=A0A7W9UW25_9ACTN|nr:AraC family transcriptional regulator [Streptomyces zagrosensis]MBB5933092.1 AraC-like DNA-binding protein [Streptomyces zagrosensis]
MDALADLLDGARARGALFHQSILTPPWSLRFLHGTPLALVTMLRGDAWIAPGAGTTPVPLRSGDIALVRGPQPYTISDRPGSAPQVLIHSADCCTTPDGQDVSQALTLGVRTYGESQEGSALLLSGGYQLTSDVGERLLAALPPVIVLTEECWDCPLMPVVAEEIVRDAPGQQIVLDRLLDLLLISTLRAWFARPEAGAPAWYRAQSDPVVGRALRLLHDAPAHAWTVAELAAKTGVSRAALARHFTRLVGEPPMTYLTGWRMTLAANLLREPDTTVETVARRVGYANAFALSVAFKRVRGVSPSAHRAQAQRAGRSQPGRSQHTPPSQPAQVQPSSRHVALPQA